MGFFEGEPVPVLSSARLSIGRACSSVHPFPAAAPIIPPPVSTSTVRAVRSVGAGLTTRSSEQAPAGGLFVYSTLDLAVPVAELEFARRLRFSFMNSLAKVFACCVYCALLVACSIVFAGLCVGIWEVATHWQEPARWVGMMAGVFLVVSLMVGAVEWHTLWYVILFFGGLGELAPAHVSGGRLWLLRSPLW